MKTKFYVCEDVRQEVNNKLTIIGLYSDDVIVINKPEKQVINEKEFELSIITRMVILVTVYDFVGQVVLTGSFISPKNELHSTPQELGSRELLEGQSHNFIFDVSGFPVIMDGIYKFKLKINDQNFDYPIEIRYA